jgi:hypothetical protein
VTAYQCGERRLPEPQAERAKESATCAYNYEDHLTHILCRAAIAMALREREASLGSNGLAPERASSTESLRVESSALLGMTEKKGGRP